MGVLERDGVLVVVDKIWKDSGDQEEVLSIEKLAGTRQK